MFSADTGTIRAASAQLETVTHGLIGGVASIQAAGAAITPPGSDGASMVAAVQQKESLAEYSAVLTQGLKNLATGVPMSAQAAALFDAEDTIGAAEIATS